jgi:hypothetical protein
MTACPASGIITISYDIIRRFRAGQAENADQTLLGAYMDSKDPDTGEAMSASISPATRPPLVY